MCLNCELNATQFIESIYSGVLNESWYTFSMEDNNVPPAPQPVPPVSQPAPVVPPPSQPTTPANPSPASPTQPVPPPPPPPAPKPTTTSSGFVPRRESSPIKKILLILVLLLAVGLVAVFVIRFLQGRNPANENQVLTYWGLWEPEAVMRPLFDEFEQQHPGVKVDYKLQRVTEYRERLTSALSQNQAPDIMRIHSSWLPMFRGELSPVPGDVYNPTDFEATFYPVAKNMLSSGGTLYAVPLEYDGLAMYINDDILTQRNLSVPKTWDELRIAALSMSRCYTETGACSPGQRIDIAGVGMGLTDNVDHWQDIIAVLLLQNGVNIANPTGEAADAVFAYFANFSRAYGTWSNELPSSTQLFASGKLGIYFAPSWRVFDIKAINPNVKFSIHPIPQLPVDIDRGEKPIQWASFWAEAVNAKSPRTKAAWDLVKFLSSADAQKKMFASAKTYGRDFGEPYSRKDLKSEISTDPYVGPFIDQADLAQSWYIASSTSDGANGINTQLSNAFAQAVNAGVSGDLANQVSTILSKYGLTTGAPTR